jgi:Putative prokaryotic signal transducing protein
MDTHEEETHEEGTREENADASEFVTVAKFMNPMEAQMAKSALESEGILVFLQGENANSLVSMALGTRLLVSASDEAAARELLESVGEASLPEDEEQ